MITWEEGEKLQPEAGPAPWRAFNSASISIFFLKVRAKDGEGVCITVADSR